jgi:hypothetical protein
MVIGGRLAEQYNKIEECKIVQIKTVTTLAGICYSDLIGMCCD